MKYLFYIINYQTYSNKKNNNSTKIIKNSNKYFLFKDKYYA